jgi:hypothetical protein
MVFNQSLPRMVGLLSMIATLSAGSAAGVADGATLRTDAAAPVSLSGTEIVRAESGWHDSPGDAEREASTALDAAVVRETDRLRAAGKRVIGGLTHSALVEERSEAGRSSFKCNMRRDLNWVEEAQRVMGMVSGPVGPMSGEQVALEATLIGRAQAHPTLAGLHSPVFTNPRITNSNVTLGDVIVSTPTSAVSEEFVFNNASDQQQTKTFTIRLSVTNGEVFVYNRGIVTTTEATANLKIDAIGVGASGRFTRQVSISNSTTSSTTTVKDYTEQFTQTIPPRTSLRLRTTREIINQEYSLKGPVTFDGTITAYRTYKDVYGCGEFNTRRCSRMKTTAHPVTLSNLLSAQDRTLEVDGKLTIHSSENTRTTTTWSSSPITN